MRARALAPSPPARVSDGGVNVGDESLVSLRVHKTGIGPPPKDGNNNNNRTDTLRRT